LLTSIKICYGLLKRATEILVEVKKKKKKKKKAQISVFEQEAPEFHAAGKTLPPVLTTLPSQSDKETRDPQD